MRQFSCLSGVKEHDARAIINDASFLVPLTADKISINCEANTRVDFSRINGSYTEYQATLRSASGAILALAIV